MQYNADIQKPGVRPDPFLVIILLAIGTLWLYLPHPIYIVAIGLLPIAIVSVLRFTFLIVLSFVIFSFFRIHEVIPQLYSLKIPLLLSMASFFSLAWHITITQKIEIYWSPLLTTISIFFFLVIIGILFATNRPIAIEYFKNIYWKIIVMLFAIAWLTRSAKDFQMSLSLIVVAGLLVGLTAISNKLNGIGLVEETRVTIGRELGSVLGDPNDLALVLMFPMAFAVGLSMNKDLPRFLRFLGIVSVPILFWAVIATQSRGGLFGTLAIFGIFGYRSMKSKILFFSLGGMFALILFVAAGISDRKSGGAAEEGLDASAQGRLYAWEAAIGMGTENPITGVGLHNFYSNYFFYSKHWDGLNHAVHSTWFGVFAETGILGFIVFVILIVGLFRSSLHSVVTLEKLKNPIVSSHDLTVMIASAQSITAGLTGVVVSGTFLTHGFTWPIYILTGLVVALQRWVKDFAHEAQ